MKNPGGPLWVGPEGGRWASVLRIGGRNKALLLVVLAAIVATAVANVATTFAVVIIVVWGIVIVLGWRMGRGRGRGYKCRFSLEFLFGELFLVGFIQ